MRQPLPLWCVLHRFPLRSPPYLQLARALLCHAAETNPLERKPEMPLFLIPFVILACGNTRMHKHQADAAMMEAQTHRAEYELHLAEFNAAHHVSNKAPKAALVRN